MNKTERELVATYMENHDTEYILQNYDEVAQFLTTPDLRDNFLTAVHELRDLSQDNRSSNNTINFEDYRLNREQTTKTPQFEMPEGYSINEYGEIIRPAREEKQEPIQETINVQSNETKLSLKQRVAQFLQKNNSFFRNYLSFQWISYIFFLNRMRKRDFRDAEIPFSFNRHIQRTGCVLRCSHSAMPNMTRSTMAR